MPHLNNVTNNPFFTQPPDISQGFGSQFRGGQQTAQGFLQNSFLGGNQVGGQSGVFGAQSGGSGGGLLGGGIGGLDPISLGISAVAEVGGAINQGFQDRKEISRLGNTAADRLQFGADGQPLLNTQRIDESISDLQGLGRKPKFGSFVKDAAKGPKGFINNAFKIGKARKARRSLTKAKQTKEETLDRFNVANESFFGRQTAQRSFLAGRDRRLREQQLFGIPTIGNPFFT